jgi:hypothetical protein
VPVIESLVAEAAQSRETKSLDVSSITPLGDRQSWSGRALVRGSTVLDASMAHAVSLAYVVAAAGICTPFDELEIRFAIHDDLRLSITPQETSHASSVDPGLTWHMSPGSTILRKDLHKQYDGNPQAGMAPSARTPNLFVFSDPSIGEMYGYLDHSDGDVFHYYGMGRIGPQRMEGPNKALLEHKRAGRTLRVFQGVGGEITYLGEFELDQDEPYYWAEARDWESETLRRVIVFKLQSLNYAFERAPAHQRSAGRPRYRPANEKRRSAPGKLRVFDPDAIDRATNRHSALQNRLAAHVESQGARTYGRGSLDPVFDLAWETSDAFYLAEVKTLTSTNEASQLRLGLGQLLHYRYLFEKERSGDRGGAIC